MKGRWLARILFISTLLMFIPSVSADFYLSNSQDWHDVYSVMLMGSLDKTQAKFLVSERHGPLMLNIVPKDTDIYIFTSKKVPYVFGYENMMQGSGVKSATETRYDNMNLELLDRLPDVTSFIVLDDGYGYNAIAVAPYAAMTGSYVLFANSKNIDDVIDVLDERQVEGVIIYGHVDREVLEGMEKFNPEIINKDGDRFENNIEIVKKYREINPAKQVVLTNGEFIEAEIMLGVEPVLFIGKENVPPKIKDYIQSTDIEVGVLIGNELVGTATVVRRQVGISTFVKFAQGARAAAGSIAQVEGLDRFYLPSVQPGLEIISVKYNKLTGSLEITFRNNASVISYFSGTYTFSVGGEQFVLGDDDPVFIDKNDVKTMVYKLDGTVPEGDMTLKAYVVYGESKGSMEFIIDKTYSVSTVEIGDEAQITIEKVQYDKAKDEFLIHLKNIGEVDAHADAEIVDIEILGETVTLGAEEIVSLKAGKKAVSVVEAELSDEELEDNSLITVRVHYGEREDALIKILEGEYDVTIKSFDVWTYAPYAVIVLLLLLILFGRRKCKQCGHKNPRSRKHCKKCKHPLK